MSETRTDLGEDLLRPSPDGEDSALVRSDLPVPEQFRTAEILLSEGLVEEAKKAFRRVLIQDSRHAGALRRLEEIHELELKQIFGSTPGSDAKTVHTSESDLEGVISSLDQDLKLNISPLSEMDLFQDRARLEKFSRKLDQDLVGLSVQERTDIGIAFLEMGLNEMAARQFRSALRSDGADRPKVATLLATALLQANQPYEAVLILESWLSDSEMTPSERIHFYYLMGRSYERLNKPIDAGKWYREAHRIEPTSRDVATRLDVG